MEAWQKELIRENFSELIKDTKCTSEFLSFFYEKGILGIGECQLIAGKETDAEKNVEFYRIIETRTNAFQILKDGLNKYLQSGARSLLESSSTSTAKRDISFDEVPPVQSFTGRTKELEQLHQMVLRSQGADRVAVVSQVTSVSGLGGIGKTQLAREYVRLKGKEFDGNVLWMNAESEESLTTSFQRFAKEKLKLPTKDLNGREIPAKFIAEAVYKYFEWNRALLVLDNAEKSLWLRQFMPKVGQTPSLFILITSREREWDRGMEVLQLDGLTEEDAVKLIQQELGIDSNDIDQMEDIRKLAQILQCFPLALQQAIAYIYEQQLTSDFTIKDYLGKFERKQQELLNYMKKDGICDPIFTTTTTATTWSITFDKIKKDKDIGWLARLILNTVAYLGADNIERYLLYLIPSLASEAQFSFVNSEQINEAVRLLVRYSILNGREKQSVLSVHRLVQAVTRNQLARDGKEEYFLEIAIHLLHGNKNYFSAENIGHALIVWRHAFKFNTIIQCNESLVYQTLWRIRKAGYHDEGIRFGNEALEKLKNVLGENHMGTLYVRRCIGLILMQQGYAHKALSIFQNIHSKANSLFGEDSDLSILTMEDLGNALQESGNSKEAREILREVFEKKKIISGDDQEDTLITVTSHGLALLDQDESYEKSEKILQKITKVHVEKEGSNSINVLRLQNNLSVIYHLMGNPEKALEIRKELYEKLTPVWREDISLFACVCHNLGISLIQIKNFEEALEISEGNIEKIKKHLGSNHQQILSIQKLIGISYCSLGNLSGALEIFKSVHQGFVLLSGEDSLKALIANKDIAITFSLLEEHAEALSKFCKIIPKMETLLGKKNWDLLFAKWEYVDAIERSGENFPMALDLLLNIKSSMISFVGKQLTPEHEASLANDFIGILKKIGDLDNAISILRDILPKAKLQLGEDSEFYLETKEELGNALIQNEKFKEAKQVLEEVLQKKEQLFGKDHVSTLRCKMNYGKALMENKNLDGAYVTKKE